jgi:hypothetical protein
MLRVAVLDLRTQGETRRQDVATAAAWVESTDVAWPLAFVNVCGVLDLDPAAVRAALFGGRAVEPASAVMGRASSRRPFCPRNRKTLPSRPQGRYLGS